MISEYFTERFGLTKEGSDNLIKGILYTALLNIAFMLPVGLYALLIYMWVEPLTGGEIIDPNLGMFIVLILIVLGIIFALAWKQYHMYSIQHTQKVKTEESILVKT
jgi:ATP-binding cassette subfamily B protein